MKKILKLFIIAAASAALLCGCSEEPVISETVVSSETTTENYDYLLVRPWVGSELLGSIYFCGDKRPLPMSLEETGFSVLDGVLRLPEGTASAELGEDGNIVGLMFERSSAPSDFSVYGIDFSSDPNDISAQIGIADSIYGSPDETVTYSFFGGGITELTFVYTERKLMSVYIVA